jgi:hypothetical protein
LLSVSSITLLRMLHFDTFTVAKSEVVTSVALQEVVALAPQIWHDRTRCMQAPPVTCRIAPLQDGIVRTCFRPEKAGPYSLIVKLDPSQGASVSRPATLTQTVTCVAGPMDIAKSRIERSDATVVAGRTGTLSISCCDIFGNPTCNVPIIPLTLVRCRLHLASGDGTVLIAMVVDVAEQLHMRNKHKMLSIKLQPKSAVRVTSKHRTNTWSES